MIFLKSQLELKETVQKIPQRHDTRWASCFNLVDTVYKRYQEILITLCHRAEEYDRQSITATSLYHKLAGGRFILTIVLLHIVLGIFNQPSLYLQSTSINWHHAIHEISVVKKTIEDLNNPHILSDNIKKAEILSEKCAIPLTLNNTLYHTKNCTISEINPAEILNNITNQVRNPISDALDKRFSIPSINILKWAKFSN